MLSIIVLAVLTAMVGCSPAPIPSATATSTITPATFDQASATVTSKEGLKLTMSINSTTYQPGEQVSVTINEKNTLATENDVKAASDWPGQGLSVGPCGTLNYPFGMSILQGYYDTKSVASVTPLRLYDPDATYHCPMILAGITAYDFQPASNTAAITTSSGSGLSAVDMTAGVKSAGFWSGSPKATFSNFAPGVYTVVGGDEWGTVVILHFVVS